ncbi:hypothetical protein PINS_up001472 [Pythium insidiosum]|nr:hypothetical protein PINS_up001472 [Pythium insidiosum]
MIMEPEPTPTMETDAMISKREDDHRGERPSHAAYTQIVLLSVVCFCCPGLFNALSSFASGLDDPTLAFNGNVVIYLCFTASSAVAAACVVALGVPRALTLGTLGYLLYTASLWFLQTRGITGGDAADDTARVIFFMACAALGASAGLLWTAQGQMIMSYATHCNQGRYLSTFWIIFNLGATSGGVLTFCLNYNSPTTRDPGNTKRSVAPATFLAFMLLTAVGTAIAALLIVPPCDVVKEDGERVTQATNTSHVQHNEDDDAALSWWRHMQALAHYVASHAEIALLFPCFVYSNWFYTYHSFFNVATFNARSGGLASACYWAAQMLSAHYLGRALDHAAATNGPLVIAKRSLLGLAALWNVMWAWGWYVQQTELGLSYAAPLGLDLVRDAARLRGPLLLYVVYGAGDAVGQVWIYWFLSSVCASGKNVRVAGYHAGLYKAIQALSAAVSWYLGATQLAPSRQLEINWLLANLAVTGAWLSLVGMNKRGGTRFLGLKGSGVATKSTGKRKSEAEAEAEEPSMTMYTVA